MKRTTALFFICIQLNIFATSNMVDDIRSATFGKESTTIIAASDLKRSEFDAPSPENSDIDQMVSVFLKNLERWALAEQQVREVCPHSLKIYGSISQLLLAAQNHATDNSNPIFLLETPKCHNALAQLMKITRTKKPANKASLIT